MIPAILFRLPSDFSEDYQKEFKIAEKYFPVYTRRSQIPSNSLTIGRYSVLPYYKELEDDLRYNDSCLINTQKQHRWIADIANYVPILGEDTPFTWFRLEDVPDDVGSVILKGETNSCKHKWKSHMFANNKREAIDVYLKLQDILVDQKIYVRKYIPLETLMVDAISEQPITKEFRIFVYQNKILTSGFYWSSHVDDLKSIPSVDEIPTEWLNSILNKIKSHATAYVVDVAKTQNGKWIVVELNDLQMSGLSECDPEQLYKNLKKEINDEANNR